MSNFLLDFSVPVRQQPLWLKLTYFVLLTFFMYFFTMLFCAFSGGMFGDEGSATRFNNFFISFGVFWITPILISLLFVPFAQVSSFLRVNSRVNMMAVVLASVAILSSIPFINWMTHVNELAFPMTDRQVVLEEKLNALLLTDSWLVCIVNVVVFALVPAVGEELFFRGFLQNVLVSHKVNSHVAVILVGCLFSFFHFQMSAFFPRWVLGVYLGYLMLWSGSLWLSAFAHFVNNATIVLVAFFFNNQIAGVDLDSIGIDNFGLSACSFVLFVGVIWFIYRLLKPTDLKNLPTNQCP